MIIKLENIPFTLEEMLYHISRGRSNHFSPLILEKVTEFEKQLKAAQLRADSAEKELQKYLQSNPSKV